MNRKLPELTQKNSIYYAFFMVLGLASLVFVPLIIWDRGYFFFYGDFNLQQIPFYQLVHDAVRSGEIFWNWKTDLGANFIGSYSFYTLFSPFFWLTLPFPNSFLPHLMAPLLILKTACAAFTASLYIRRFTKEPVWTVAGGLLYGFSGWAVYNIFFNHFHEPLVFFPLMLVGLEELMEKGRTGRFVLAVFINAVVNYWFFIGSVVFVIFYFIVRSSSPGWQFSIKKFIKTTWEGFLGCLLAACVLMPSALAIVGNPRTGAEKLLTGWGLWGYSQQQKIPALLHSLFFPPDMPSLANFFPDANTKWASLSLYLPLFGAVCVIAFLAAKKGHWLRRMIILSFVLAAVPAFNALFILLNNSYYARWFYMPTLMLALATVLALEERESMSFRSGVVWSGIMIFAITLAVGFSPKLMNDKLEFGLYLYPEKFWINVALAAASLIITALLLALSKSDIDFPRLTIRVLSAMCVLMAFTLLLEGRLTFSNNDWIADKALAARGKIELPDDTEFARSDFYESEGNMGMFWDLPNIQCFHSIVPPSIMEFYPEIGVKRDVSSKPGTDDVALRALLSVRWLFVDRDDAQESPMPDFEFRNNQYGHDLYENLNYVPMGFTYDYYTPRSELEHVPQNQRTRLMMRSLIIEDEYISVADENMDRLPMNEFDELSLRYLAHDAIDRRETTGSFAVTKRGFTGSISLPRSNLVFYSVPYDRGWSATVNGEPAEIIKANIGFMAVAAPEGDNEIIFTYNPPGLKYGLIISAAALIIFALYMFVLAKYGEEPPQDGEKYNSEEKQ